MLKDTLERLDTVREQIVTAEAEVGMLISSVENLDSTPRGFGALADRVAVGKALEKQLLGLLADAVVPAAAQYAADELAAYHTFMAAEITPRGKERDRLNEEIWHIQSSGANLFTGMTAARSPSPRLGEIPALKGKRAVLQAELEALAPQMHNLDGAARDARALERRLRGLVGNGKGEQAVRELLMVNGRTHAENATSRKQPEDVAAHA